MAATSDLTRLLAEMSPQLRSGAYVFVHATAQVAARTSPVMTFVEDEGTTLILTARQAEELGLVPDFVAAWITLTVHSALDAVGLTAAVSGALAEAGVSCNVVAAVFHDHLFVPHGDAGRAMAVLADLSSGSAATPT